MGLFDWLKKVVRPGAEPQPVVREVARLDHPADDVDTVKEVVDRSGAPLKPGHRRRALRDPRLLPKPKPRARPSLLQAQKRPRLLEADEARRLFAATLRTRDRRLRDLLPDEEQLARHGLPVWRTEADVAAALGISVGTLRFFTIHRQAEPVCHYVTFAIPKRSGGRRLIMAPKRRLKALQRMLLEPLVSRLPVSDHAHGFLPGRSIRTNAAPHVGRQVVLTMDLTDFFPTVTFGRVRGYLVAMGYGYIVATILAVLMTEAERQPVEVDGKLFHVPVGHRHCVQGAPTSPALCNGIALRLDRRLAGLARTFGFTYTRYADDLTFSGDDPAGVKALHAIATRIIESEGFRVNAAKTRVARRGSRQEVTGVTVNDVLGLSRRERREIRAMAHRTRQAIAAGVSDPARLTVLRGKLAYLAMLNPAQADALRRGLPPEAGGLRGV